MTGQRSKRITEQLIRDAANGVPWRIKISGLERGAVKEIYLHDIIRWPENLAYLIEVAQDDLRAIARHAGDLDDADAIAGVVEYLDILRVIALSEAQRSPGGFWPTDPDPEA